MDVLPYEVLQLVADGLLPRYQCRLALTSRFCYQYLYNDLLKWHARKARIPIPIHTFMNKDCTIVYTHKILITYIAVITGIQPLTYINNVILSVMNYSTNKGFLMYDIDKLVRIESTYQSTGILYDHVRSMYNYLSHPIYRKHLHKKFLIIMANMNAVRKLHCINVKIRLMALLDNETKATLRQCPHLRAIFL